MRSAWTAPTTTVASAASSVTVTPAGLAVITTTNVQAALAQLDAAVGRPTSAAGGALTGAYPDPDVAAGYLSNVHVSSSAAIAESKLALASDASSTIPSRRVSRFRSGVSEYKGDMWGGNVVATQALAAGFIYYAPFFVSEAETWDAIQGRVGTTAPVGGTGLVSDIGIYGDNGSQLPAGAPLATVMGVAVPAGANNTIQWNLATPLALQAGVYWIAQGYRYTTAPTTAPTWYVYTGTTPPHSSGPNITALGNYAYYNYVATMPNPAVIGGRNGAFRPYLGVHVSSRP